MGETKSFPTAKVLSSVTGTLLCEIGGVYEVLSWMAGEDVYTHQIPRISVEAQAAILALHPHLADVFAEAEQVNRDNWQAWLATWIDRYGDEITVPRMSPAEHKRIDPISELAERIHPDRITIIGGAS